MYLGDWRKKKNSRTRATWEWWWVSKSAPKPGQDGLLVNVYQRKKNTTVQEVKKRKTP